MSDSQLFDEDTYEEEPAPARRKRRWRDRWLLLTIVGVLGIALLLVVVIGGWYGKAALDALDSIKREPTIMPSRDRTGAPLPVDPKEGNEDPPINFVLMGTDARNPDEQGRSDVLLVLHLSGDREDAYLVSFPRDYWVGIPGRGTAKINAAYSWGGPALSVETLESLLDVPMDHTAMIDFEGFMNVIDAVGGVTVNNKYASGSGGYSFPAGRVDLTGESALVYVRERYSLPEGDFSRAERQRDVIQAVVSKLTSRGVLANPGMFRDAVTTLGPNFTVDEGLTNSKIIDLGLDVGIGGGDDIVSLQAPTAGFGTSPDGQAYVRVDEEQLAEMATAMRDDTMDEYAEAHPG